MSQYINTEIQTVSQSTNVVLYNTTDSNKCCLIYHKDGSSVIKLFPIKGKCFTRFKITYSGNIAVPTGETPGAISVAIAIDGEPDQATTAIVTPAAVDEYFNVSTSAYIYVRHNCCATIGIRNTSTIPINMQNANIIITRE